MKIKSEFALKKFQDSWVAVSVNDNSNEGNLFITLNDSGAYVWNLLTNNTSYDEVISKMIEKYNINKELAQNDLNVFIDKMRKANILDE